MLPADDVSYGFDNIAGVQRMSPTLMERYLSAARKISSVAVGASLRAATTETYLVPPELRQDDRLDGLPFGTRGGAALRYTFPRDGEYGVRVQLTRNAGASSTRSHLRPDAAARAQHRRRAGSRLRAHSRDASERTRCDQAEPPRARCRLDGASSGEGRSADGDADVPEQHAGAARESSRAVREAGPGGPNGYYPTQKGAYLRNVEIIGPFTIAEPGDTPSRRRSSCAGPRMRRRSGLFEEDYLNHGPPRVQAAG